MLGGTPQPQRCPGQVGLTRQFPDNVKQVARSLCCQLAVSSDKSVHLSEPQHLEKLQLMVLKEGTLS